MIISSSYARRGLPWMLPLVLGACSAGRGAEGPYLPQGPLPSVRTTEGVTPALPPSWARPAPGPWGDAAGADARNAGLPSGLVAAGGLARLPGARLSGVGPVQALVVPVSLGDRRPERDENALVREVFGSGDRGGGSTLSRALEAASNGKFRLSVVPVSPLVDTRAGGEVDDPARLRSLAEATMREWSRQVDLAFFDNDGPDGVAGTPDDDGTIDLFIVSVEADQPVASVTLRDGFSVASPTRRTPLETGPVHVLGLGRSGGDALAPAIGLVLDALGLDSGERFFPTGFPRMISTIARVRLGWVGARLVPAGSPVGPVPAGEVVLVPLADLASGTGFWMIENDGSRTYATRAVRTASGHYAATDVKIWEGPALQLPLSRQLGVLGPRVVIEGAGTPALAWAGLPEPDMAPRPEPLSARW
jgi:hypothetical protein